MSGGVNELPVMIPGICCWWQSTDRTKDPPHVLHRKFSSKRVPRIGWFSPNIAHAHPPVCSRLPPPCPAQKPPEAANAGLRGNAAEREQSLTYKLCRSSPNAAAAVRRSISLLVAGMQLGFSSNPPPHPDPPFTEEASTTTPSGGAVLHVALLLAFFSLSSTSELGGAESARIDLNREATRWGGKERKQERCVEFDAFMAGGAAVSVRMGKREDGRMNENPICKI